MAEQKRIDYRFKILYFFGIVFILLGHMGNTLKPMTDWFPLYSFHLALFVFASGYFFKDESLNNPLKYIWKKIKHLLIPLFLYNVFYGVFTLILRQCGFNYGKAMSVETIFLMPLWSGHQFGFNLGAWFLVPLFMIEVANCLLRYAFKFLPFDMPKLVPEIFFFVVYIGLGILGNELAIIGYNTEWYLMLTRFLHFFPFYGLGIFYNRFLEKYDLRINTVFYIAVILGVQLILFTHYGGAPSYNQANMNHFEEGPVMPIVYGFLGIAFWFRICCLLEPVIGKSKFVNAIADCSLSIAINQFMGVFILNLIYWGFSCFIPVFADFAVEDFRLNFQYEFIINKVYISVTLYIAFGILVPVLIQKGLNLVKKYSLILIGKAKSKFQKQQARA